MGVIQPSADVAAPKPSLKKAKEKKKAGPKLIPNPTTPRPAVLGDNMAHPEVIAAMDETLGIDEQIKALNKAKRDIRNNMKTQFNILAWNWSHEVAMRKKDKDVRIALESGAVDLKNMLGYQASLDLQPETVARTEEEFADPSNKVRPEEIQREG